MCHLNVLLTLLVVLSFGTAHAQPTKTLTGRILDNRLEGLPAADICAQDTTVIGTTDKEGYFQIDVPIDTYTLLVSYVGMEWAVVNLSAACLNIEIILLYTSSYDFMSVRRVNRQRFSRFKHLPRRHQEAYEKGLFKSRIPCAFPIFTKWVPRPAK